MTALRRHAVAGVALRERPGGDHEVLLIRSLKRGGVELPGGGIEGLWTPAEKVETDAEALARELLEETSTVLARVLGYLGVYRGDDFVCRFYACEVTGDPVPGSDALEAGYASPEELASGTAPHDVAMTELALRIHRGQARWPAVPTGEIKRERQQTRRQLLELDRDARLLREEQARRASYARMMRSRSALPVVVQAALALSSGFMGPIGRGRW